MLDDTFMNIKLSIVFKINKNQVLYTHTHTKIYVNIIFYVSIVTMVKAQQSKYFFYKCLFISYIWANL